VKIWRKHRIAIDLIGLAIIGQITSLNGFRLGAWGAAMLRPYITEPDGKKM
jgi:hypothetical protein